MEVTGPLGGSLTGLLAQTAATLASIHRMGLVYGGLAPARVLFDLGEWLLEAPSGPAVPVAGYAAPELRPGPAADVFAWGSLAVYAANGRPAFSDDLAVPDLGVLPDHLRAVVMAALSLDPGERPAAGDLADLLTGGSPADPGPAQRGPVPDVKSAPPPQAAPKGPSLVGLLMFVLAVVALVIAALTLDGSV